MRAAPSDEGNQALLEEVTVEELEAGRAPIAAGAGYGATH